MALSLGYPATSCDTNKKASKSTINKWQATRVCLLAVARELFLWVFSPFRQLL